MKERGEGSEWVLPAFSYRFDIFPLWLLLDILDNGTNSAEE